MTSPIKTFSYSSIFSDFQECGYRYKLKHVDKLPCFTNSIDTIFGKFIHNRVQKILLGKETTKESLNKFNITWKNFFRLYRNQLDESKCLSYHKAALGIIKNAEDAFKDYRALTAEEQLLYKINEQGQHFKGFIDLVLVDKKDETKLVIVDLKTAGSAFFFKEYLTTYKTYQLVLYKHFYSEIKNISIDNISLKFVVLEKNPKSKKPIVFIDVPCGKKKINNCLKVLDTSIKAINEGKFLKNKSACFKVGTEIKCPFFNTEYCEKEK